MQPKLEITSLHSSGGSREFISVTKNGISFPVHFANRMGIKKGDYLQTAILGSNMYVAKRPQGMFGGYKLMEVGGNESGRISINVKIEIIKFIVGKFRLSEKSFSQEYDGEFGKKVMVEWWTLEPA